MPLAAGENPDGTLLPGESEELQLHFEPETLATGLYPAQLLIDTDVFNVEITPIEVQI